MPETPPAASVELRIEKLVAGGDGLARLDGLVVLVSGTAPGDRVEAEIVERRKGFGRARVLRVVEPGPDRREPPCPHAATCGGCSLQHLEDAAGRRARVAATLETLTRVGRLDALPPPRVIAGDAWGFRLRTRLHLEAEASGVRLGFVGRDGRSLVEIERCPVMLPALDAALPTLRARLGALTGLAWGRHEVDACVGDDGTLAALLDGRPIEGVSEGPVEATVAGEAYRFDPGSFFQAHRGLLDALVAEVTGPGGFVPGQPGAGAPGAEPDATPAVELYAGAGLFTVPLARQRAQLVAVESDPRAARRLRENLARRGLAHVKVVEKPVEKWIDRLAAAPGDVWVDPPRTGLPSLVRRVLVERPPRRLTYVSCDPATLARDLAALSPVLAVRSLAFLDLFPQTGHIEVVAHLARAT